MILLKQNPVPDLKTTYNSEAARKPWLGTMPCCLCGSSFPALNFCFFFFKKKEKNKIVLAIAYLPA
jgi:hypothetical protein